MLLRILRQGTLEAGDAVLLDPPPAHGVTAADINRVYYGDVKDLGAIRAAPELASHWHAWAEHRTVWHEEDTSTGRDRPARAQD